MFVFNPFYETLLIVISALVPGLLLGLPLLRRTKFSMFEKVVLSFVIGVFVPPFLSFLENGFIGIPFSPVMVYANILLVSVIGLFLCWRTGYFDKEKTKKLIIKPDKTSLLSVLKSPSLWIFFIMLLAWFLRFQAWSPVYQELDPYFYVYGTKQLLTLGYKPMVDNTAWYPLVQTSHRGSSLYHFMLGHWYYLYSQHFDKYVLTAVASMYPPIVTALMVFMAFLFVKEIYDYRYGLFAAALLALLPSTLMKMAAGVFELQPMSLFFIFMFFAFFIRALKTRNRWYYAVSGLILGGQVLCATAYQLPLVVMFIFFTLYSAYLYLRKEDRLFDYLRNYVYLFVSMTALVLLDAMYRAGLNGILNTFKSFPFLVGALSFLPLGLFYGLTKVKQVRDRDKVWVVGGVFVLGILLFFLPVTGPFLRAYIGRMVAQATYPSALWRTIQEQAPAGASFEGYLGILGADLGGIPTVQGQPARPITPLGIITVIPSIITDFAIQAIVDPVLRILFNEPLLATSTKANSFVLFFIFFAAVELFYQLYLAFRDREHKLLEVLLLASLVLPVAYVGLNKAKYEIYLSIVTVLAMVMTLYLFERWVKRFAKEGSEKNVELGFAVVMAVFVILLFIPAKWTVSAYSIMTVSFTPRYQDAPDSVAPKFNQLCTLTNNTLFCQARYPEVYIHDINDQFNQQLCMYSLVPTDVLLGKRNLTPSEQIGISYRCSKIADYWIDTMDWISKNTPKDARITSWWDYGHWINYFGDRNTVLRNEHSSLEMIGRVAYAYLHGTEQDLINTMHDYYSDYALFDSEIIMSGRGFGGKFGALNYLGCDWANKTDVTHLPGQSSCEQHNLWETIYFPLHPSDLEKCTISLSTGEEGVIGYYGGYVRVMTDKGPSYRVQLSDEKYCLSVNGSNVYMYKIDRRDDDGNLIPHGGIPMIVDMGYDLQGNPVAIANVLYTYDTITYPDGKTRYSWGDRPVNQTHFYDSNVYKAFVLDRLDGFEKVYDNGNVKIYKLLK